MVLGLGISALVFSSSSGASNLDFWAALGALLGVALFINGFTLLRYKRIILNTPFSKIRSASMGLVEVSGSAVGPHTIPAGITGDPCFYYQATAWKLEQDGKNQTWKRVADETLYVPFFVEDPTGRLLIDPQGAQLDVHRNFKDQISTSFFSTQEMIPPHVAQYLLRTGLSGQQGIRLEEYCIKPEYPLFILGTLGRNSEPPQWTPQPHVFALPPRGSISFNWGFTSASPRGSKPFNALGPLAGVQAEAPGVPPSPSRVPSLSQNPAIAAPLPTASPAPASAVWSTVSLDENSVAAAHTIVAPKKPPASAPAPVRTPLATQSAVAVAEPIVAPQSQDAAPAPGTPAAAFDTNPAVAIGKGTDRAPFTISSRSQREVVQSLAWKSALYIWGGPIVTLACLYFLADTFGWL
jgi:hypothetical protein